MINDESRWLYQTVPKSQLDQRRPVGFLKNSNAVVSAGGGGSHEDVDFEHIFQNTEKSQFHNFTNQHAPQHTRPSLFNLHCSVIAAFRAVKGTDYISVQRGVSTILYVL